MKPPVYNPHWSSDVQAVYKHDVQEIWDKSVAPHIWNQYHNQLDTYLRLANGHERFHILDVGCAQGTLALLLAERGHEVWALDLREQFLEYAKSRYTHGDIHFVCGNVFEAQFHVTFDVIFANQIIEHLLSPERLVAKLAEWLRRDGTLIITTPNGDYIKSKLPRFSELDNPSQFADKQFTADGDGHFFAYVEEELRDAFKAAGLVDIQVTYMESPWISGHMKIRYLHRWIPVGLLRLADRMTLSVPGLRRWMAHQILLIGCRKVCG